MTKGMHLKVDFYNIQTLIKLKNILKLGCSTLICSNLLISDGFFELEFF